MHTSKVWHLVMAVSEVAAGGEVDWVEVGSRLASYGGINREEKKLFRAGLRFTSHDFCKYLDLYDTEYLVHHQVSQRWRCLLEQSRQVRVQNIHTKVSANSCCVILLRNACFALIYFILLISGME